ncbi:MAG TPA: hypothetical protein VGZ23_02620 [bacterium]|nr:hypothetical protein [bacterium]
MPALGVAALRAAPREARRRIRLGIYGNAVALCALFPLAALPQPLRTRASLVVTVLILAMVVLTAVGAVRIRGAQGDHRARSLSDGHRGEMAKRAGSAAT